MDAINLKQESPAGFQHKVACEKPEVNNTSKNSRPDNAESFSHQLKRSPVSLPPDLSSARRNKPGLLELCAGSATLSFVGSKKGFQPIPVDHSRNKFRPKVPIIKLNLAEDATVDICIELINMGAVQVLLAAVPCGTASRARDIYIAGGPLPLRSDESPYGLQTLRGTDLLRVETANRIYYNCQRILVAAHYRNVICALENPDRSYVWSLNEIIHLLHIGFLDIRYQHCKWTPHKAMRAKWTRLRANRKKFLAMAGECNLPHVHLKWGKLADGSFASAGEAEYPEEFGEIFLDTCIEILQEEGYVFCPHPLDPTLESSDSHKKRRLVTGKQPRGNRLPPLISEYKDILPMTRREASMRGAKVLRSDNKVTLISSSSGGDTEGDNFVASEMLDELEDKDREATLLEGQTWEDRVIAGIYRTPEEYVEESLETPHPTDLQGGVPDELLEAIVQMLSSAPQQNLEIHLDFCKRMM